MAQPNASFDVLATATLRNARKVLADNLSVHTPLLAKLKAHGGWSTDQGGTTITEPLLHDGNSTVKSYAGYETIDTSPQEGLTTAEFEWKQLSGSVVISGIEEFKNSASKVQIVNLLKSKMKQLDISFREEVAQQILGDGTGNDSKDIGGLDSLIGVTTTGTVGGIVEASNAFWTPQRIDFNTHTDWNGGSAGTSFATTAGTSIEGLRAFRVMYNRVLRGNDRVGLILTDADTAEQYEEYTEGDKYRVTDRQLADLGFDNISFKGIPICWDDFMSNTAGTGYPYAGDTGSRVYFLNLNYLKFVVGKGRDFMTTPFMRPENQDARVANVLLYGNMVISNRARQGVIFQMPV
jgi:hypothetical protein